MRGGGVEIIFDFTRARSDHPDEATETNAGLALQPRSVADFYAEFRSHLDELEMEGAIKPHPVELVEAIPFPG